MRVRRFFCAFLTEKLSRKMENTDFWRNLYGISTGTPIFYWRGVGSRPNWLRNLPNRRWKKMEKLSTMKTVIGAEAQLHETTKECNLCYRGYRFIRT